MVPPLAVANVPPRVKVPDVLMGPPERVSPVVPPEPSMEVTVPAQLPVTILKQPLVRTMPLEKVEEAEAEKTSKAEILRPALMDEVAVLSMFR